MALVMGDIIKNRRSKWIKGAHGAMKTCAVYVEYDPKHKSVVFVARYSEIPYTDDYYFNTIAEVDKFIADKGMECD